ncbi:MAG: nodulation protein NfeD [Candidatus Omnitrophica bacterium]|nr:nodulation protein NfeD [Candidatus Omnitrophota bacterium]
MPRSNQWIPALLCGFLSAFGAGQLAQAAVVHVIELDNQIISPVTQQYITQALDRAEADSAECLVLILDTPGGLLESTRAIVKRIMNAQVPVVVYIAPSGARAGSAGVFITMAAHIAAMAPSTNIGAAHPVMAGGNQPEPSGAMADKILNDTVAWITTIARTRHRNEAWAADAVTQSFSITQDDAVRQRIVDLQANNLEELLAKLDGWPVEISGGTQTLTTAGAQVVRLPMTPRQQFLAVITNPNIAYLLMLLGTLGLVFEFTHPGFGFPGIAGLICLLLALYAFQALPVNYAGLALMGLGLVLLIAEVKVAGLGLLAVGGVVALTLGSLMLVDPAQGFGISLRLILPVVLGISAIILFLLRLVMRAQRQPAMTGAQTLIGARGTAETDLAPAGQVFLQGELWSALATSPVRKGEAVTIVGIEGLTLRVEPASPVHKEH